MSFKSLFDPLYTTPSRPVTVPSFTMSAASSSSSESSSDSESDPPRDDDDGEDDDDDDFFPFPIALAILLAALA